MLRRLILIAAAALTALAITATPAEAAGWTTIARASDNSSYFTFAYLSRSNIAKRPFRALVRAPKGRAKVTGSMFCWDPQTYDYESRNFAWRYRSRGTQQRWRHRLPVLFGNRCDVTLDVEGKGGALRLFLQRR